MLSVAVPAAAATTPQDELRKSEIETRKGWDGWSFFPWSGTRASKGGFIEKGAVVVAMVVVVVVEVVVVVTMAVVVERREEEKTLTEGITGKAVQTNANTRIRGYTLKVMMRGDKELGREVVHGGRDGLSVVWTTMSAGVTAVVLATGG